MISFRLAIVVLVGIVLASVIGCKGPVDTTEPFVNSFESHSN